MEQIEYLEKRAKLLNDQYNRLVDEAVAVQADYHKFKVAEMIAATEPPLPAGSFIHTICWDDEPHADGSYDIGLGVVYNDQGDQIDDLMGEGFPMGWADGDHTDIDEFLLGDAASDDLIIDVDKVRAWVKTICNRSHIEEN